MKRFLGFENSVDDLTKAGAVIVPVPAEFTTSYGKGTALGPEAIIDASPYLEFYDDEIDFEVWRKGIYTAKPIQTDDSVAELMKRVENEVGGYLAKKKFPLILGGEHSISYAVHQAMLDVYPDLSVLQFDAHSDLRDSYEGSQFSHACVMRRIWEKNKRITGVGIRSQSVEERQFVIEERIPLYYASRLKGGEFPAEILDTLSEQVYITFDADFFDPAIMPSVGTPEPGGFFWYETLSFIRKVFASKNVVGVDVVEFCPLKNLIHPDFLMAKFVYKLLGYKFYIEGND